MMDFEEIKRIVVSEFKRSPGLIALAIIGLVVIIITLQPKAPITTKKVVAPPCMQLPSGLCVGHSDIEIKPIADGASQYIALKAKGLIKYDSTFRDDYWAGALFECDKLGMRLPTLSAPVNNEGCPETGGGELCELYKNKEILHMAPTSYWSATEFEEPGFPTYAWYLSMSSGAQMRFTKDFKTFKARCVK